MTTGDSKSPSALLRQLHREHRVRRILVGVSCGKDATTTLDVCCEVFGRENVSGYFMYLVPGLSFQEQYLGYLERRYGISILRMPNWMLSNHFRAASFRVPTAASMTCPRVRLGDVDAWLRKKTGVEWIATGERAADSVQRNAYIRKCGGIDPVRRRVFPLALLSAAAVNLYLKQRGIMLPPDYGSMSIGRSFGTLWHRQIACVRSKYPEDYSKILKMFPMLDAQIERYRLREARGETNAQGKGGVKAKVRAN